MSERNHAAWAIVVGAALGGLVGFLFFTEHGRRLRARVEPAVADLIDNVQNWRGTIERVTAFASDVGGGERGEEPMESWSEQGRDVRPS
jgi:gas vesicle protein